MECKFNLNNQPQMVEVKYATHSEFWHPDPQVRAELVAVLRSIAAANGGSPDSIVDPVNEIERLEGLDAQVQGETQPEALSWILNARP